MTTTEQRVERVADASSAPSDRAPRASAAFGLPGVRALIAVIALFAISSVLAPGSVGAGALASMLPFAALIAVVAVGQTLVIQQGGLDLSIPGAVTLGALIVAKFGHEGSWGLTLALVGAVCIPALFGLLSGIMVALVGLPPLVVTIASNALMIGVVYAVSGGFGSQVTDELSRFSLGKIWGLPALAVIATAIVLLGHLVLKLTRWGRKFELVGENPRSAANLGISTRAYTATAYVAASALAGVAGALLAGLLRSPTLTAGNDYLLPSIAAVVLGGTALTGGRGSLIGTALGALFLAQLTQLVQTFTQATAVQNIVQAVIIGVGIVAQLQLGGSTARLRGLFTKHSP